MMDNEHIKKSILILVQKSLDGELSVSESELLNEFISCSENVEYYLKCLRISYTLRDKAYFYELSENISQDTADLDLLNELARHEKIAPTVEIPQEASQRELIQKVIYPPREKRKISKFNIVFLALNAAAILFVILFLKVTAPQPSVEVATLTDSIDARWSDVTGVMVKGARLATGGESLFLQKGLVELLFNNNAKVVIEGPAEFELLTEDRIDLRYGRIYATIPQEAIGFTVGTPTSRIIDLGTEFGVRSDIDGTTELHVVQGRTTLIAGKKLSKVSMDVAAGQAKKVAADTRSVSNIPCRQGAFVRAIDSVHNTIWRDQSEIHLTSIDMDFEGLDADSLPAEWMLVNNCGDGIGPIYASWADSGPSGAGDICGCVSPQDGNKMNPDGLTPGGWIMCHKLFDSTDGFKGSFDFQLHDVSEYADAVFLFGDVSGGTKDYYYCSFSESIYEDRFNLHAVNNGIRDKGQKLKIHSRLYPDIWYHCSFRFIPSEGTTGYFNCTITDLAGDQTLCLLEPAKITLTKTVRFGFGSYDGSACFDNIRISPMSSTERVQLNQDQ